MKRKLIIVGVLVFIGLVFLFLYQQKPTSKNTVVDKTTEGIINSATFNCAENKSIQAIFFKDKVELTLSDGRNMLLLQAISASGARYVNSDESFVFWNKGDAAFVNEGDLNTFKDCSTVPTNVGDNTNTNKITNPIACTADARQCSDGSYVGRSGPNCEFVCP